MRKPGTIEVRNAENNDELRITVTDGNDNVINEVKLVLERLLIHSWKLETHGNPLELTFSGNPSRRDG